MDNNFIEATRRGGSRVRIRADFITALLDVEVKEAEKYKKAVRLHLGPNNHIDVEDETVDTIWNKMCQAIGRNLQCITETSPGYPGHPAYGAETPRVLMATDFGGPIDQGSRTPSSSPRTPSSAAQEPLRSPQGQLLRRPPAPDPTPKEADPTPKEDTVPEAFMARRVGRAS